MVNCLVMANWSFLTSHARVLMCVAHDPGAQLRDIAASLGITEDRPGSGQWAGGSACWSKKRMSSALASGPRGSV